MQVKKNMSFLRSYFEYKNTPNVHRFKIAEVNLENCKIHKIFNIEITRMSV